MKEFRTELIPVVSLSPIGLRDEIFTMGSCFAEAIGSHLTENKFRVWNSRLGVVYNPISIHRTLLFGLENKPPASGYLRHQGINLNYHFHSSLSSLKKMELEFKIKESVAEASRFLKGANRIIITYGTSFVYRLTDTHEIVANCHKAPAGRFTRSLLTEAEVVQSFRAFYSTLKAINAACKIILTVSPVRHLKDTLELNAVSKSVLRLSCHAIVNQFPDVEYFPAYEILLDDLRDYRFYETDRLHPTDEAIAYVWEKFAKAFLDEPARKFISDWREIKRDLEHKPFHVESEGYQKFLKSTLKKLESLQSQADVSEEIHHLKSKMANRKWLIS
jgi:hypothetical protein